MKFSLYIFGRRGEGARDPTAARSGRVAWRPAPLARLSIFSLAIGVLKMRDCISCHLTALSGGFAGGRSGTADAQLGITG